MSCHGSDSLSVRWKVEGELFPSEYTKHYWSNNDIVIPHYISPSGDILASSNKCYFTAVHIDTTLLLIFSDGNVKYQGGGGRVDLVEAGLVWVGVSLYQ